VRLSGELAEVGITDYAQQQLGDVVYMELPDVGSRLTAGQPFGSIESVKAVSELFAPVSGEVVAERPSRMPGRSTEPHEAGW
jgi:glycine cleavage system H protein